MIAYTDNLLSTCISTPASQFNIGSSCNRSIQPFQFNLLPSPLIADDNALERGEKFHPVLVVEGWGFKEQMVSYAMSILIVSYRDDTWVSMTRSWLWTRKVNRRTIHLFHYHTARTVCGYRATCNSTWENTFLLINGFLTPPGHRFFNKHDSLLSICSNIHVTTPNVTSEKFYNWHQVSSRDLIFSYFLQYTPNPPPPTKKTLSYLINNFIFFIKY